jgi:type VI secretion system protein ImpJ
MRTLSPVVWSEGMHLAQHHFQRQTRYFEDAAAFSISTLFFEAWGLASCELDHEALLNGTVTVAHARGIMPDGLPFHIPEDAPPAPLEIRQRFSPTQDAHLVQLAIPAWRPDGPNCRTDGDGEDGGPDVRFTASVSPFVDETTGQGEKAVATASKNFRLLLDADVPDGLVTLPIARVRRDGSGQFVYDPAYVPPVTQLEASPALLAILSRLVDVLDAKARTLATGRLDGEQSEFAASEVSSFWLGHAVHSALPALRHMLDMRSAHPERLYLAMASLGGALCTFTAGAHPRDLPLYDHGNLEGTFSALDRHIRKHLEVVLPTGAVTLRLEPMEPYFHSAAVKDRRCLSPHAEWYLAVRPQRPDPDLTRTVPKVVKVCSAKHIVRLVREAYPGVGLEHVDSPPAAVAPRVGTRYFRLTMTEPCWASIVDTGEVGLYAPGAMDDAELELRVVVGD